MTVLRIDIERALDELTSQEEGMRFQGLAVILGKMRWRELIARQRKKDFGLDAYAPASETPTKVGRGLAASITPTLKKISDDATAAKKEFPDLGQLLFVTPAKVGNANRRRWERGIRKDHGLELHLIEREEIITQLMMPDNAVLCASFLNINSEAEPEVAELIKRIRRAADALRNTWARKTNRHPLIDLSAERLDSEGAQSGDVLSLEHINQALTPGSRIVLEGPAGRGKTTTLVQLAQLTGGRTAFIVELAAWTSSGRGIFDFLAGMPAFQAEGLTAADLARAQRTEPFLLLLNGWNQIPESNFAQASLTLAALERDLPDAAIMVATRTHNLTPPLPGAVRLRLLRLRREQRAQYLSARLGAKAADLQDRIDSDPSLEELTRTPLILSEVASLFEAGAAIPSTKLGVLAAVLHMQEQRDEHNNALQAAPIFGCQSDFLTALAIEMTRLGTVSLSEAEARSVVGGVVQDLSARGQIAPAVAPVVLTTLTAHHVLERVDYPQTTFQFEHPQLQEYYAAADLCVKLTGLQDTDRQSIEQFQRVYVNDPVWAEPLYMIAETLAEQSGDEATDNRRVRAGRHLAEMALDVDLIFAGELAQLCGQKVWNQVRNPVGERFRAIYATGSSTYRECALAAMLATGSCDFRDVTLPILSAQDKQTRLHTYRLWPEIQVSSFGVDWREQVRKWSDAARADFVYELLHHRVDREVAEFAVDDTNWEVKNAAVSGLMWTGAEDLLTRVLASMPSASFDEFARKNAERMPAALKSQTIAAVRTFIASTSDQWDRLRAALDLIKLGETDQDAVVKEAMAGLTKDDLHNAAVRYIQPALEYLRNVDPAWASEWVAVRVAEGALYEHEHWLAFATAIPRGLLETYLTRLLTEELDFRDSRGMTAVVAAKANPEIAARIFTRLRELEGKIDADLQGRHELEWRLIAQLKKLYRKLPDEIAAGAILACVNHGDPMDIMVAADILSVVALPDAEPMRLTDDQLRERLCAYLKGGVDLVLCRDDFNGSEKADLASAIAQLGTPDDVADVMRLIRSDLARLRRGHAARAAGERGPISDGASMSYSRWNIEALMSLDPDGADQALIDLLPEPEYRSDIAAAMAGCCRTKSNGPFDRTFRADLMWASREGRAPASVSEMRCKRFAAALHEEIKRRRNSSGDGRPKGLSTLARALAAVDGYSSAALVLDIIAIPGEWDESIRIEAAEHLLIAGAPLPSVVAFAMVESVLVRTVKRFEDSDKYRLGRILALCAFVDDPIAGIATIRNVVLGKGLLRGHDLVPIISALGESRLEEAVPVLRELASDAATIAACEDTFINALAKLDTAGARELLLSFVDPDVPALAAKRLRREDVLVLRLTELAERNPAVADRMRRLCEGQLPELNRHVLAKVMGSLGMVAALAASLNLIDDANRWPIPEGTLDQLESAFVLRRPDGRFPDAFTLHANASNEVRARLFKMAREDVQRRKSASVILGQIEIWRLEHGRPAGEPRHPDLSSGRPWPPNEP